MSALIDLMDAWLEKKAGDQIINTLNNTTMKVNITFEFSPLELLQELSTRAQELKITDSKTPQKININKEVNVIETAGTTSDEKVRVYKVKSSKTNRSIVKMKEGFWNKVTEEKECKYCKRSFKPRANSQLYCSDECKEKAYSARALSKAEKRFAKHSPVQINQRTSSSQDNSFYKQKLAEKKRIEQAEKERLEAMDLSKIDWDKAKKTKSL